MYYKHYLDVSIHMLLQPVTVSMQRSDQGFSNVASCCIVLCIHVKHCTDDIRCALQKEVSEANSFVFDWQNLAPGVALLLAEATNWQPPSFTVRIRMYA